MNKRVPKKLQLVATTVRTMTDERLAHVAAGLRPKSHKPTMTSAGTDPDDLCEPCW